MDWKNIISDIQAALGLTQAQIAHKVGLSQVSISELASGKTGEPRFGAGSALLGLHRKALRTSKRRLAKEGV